MKRLTISVLLTAICAVAAVLSTPTQTVGAEGFEWVTDYDAGIKKAAAENKPIFLEFRCMP
jgi:hypothetical protein